MIGFRTLLAAAGRGLAQAVAAVTWNPDDKHVDIILSNNNLTATASSFNRTVRATEGKSAGKWYFEVYADADTNGKPSYGVATSAHSLSNEIGQSATSWAYYGGDGRKYHNGSLASYGSNPATGNIIGVAVDMDTGKIWWALDNVWQASGNPAEGTNEAYSNLPVGTALFPAISLNPDDQGTARFKSADLTYTPPSGFSAWES